MPGGALGTWTESVKSQERNELQEPPIKNPLKIKAASQTLGSREVSLETQKKKKKKQGCLSDHKEKGMRSGKHLASLGFKSGEMLQLIFIAPKVL